MKLHKLFLNTVKLTKYSTSRIFIQADLTTESICASSPVLGFCFLSKFNNSSFFNTIGLFVGIFNFMVVDKMIEIKASKFVIDTNFKTFYS